MINTGYCNSEYYADPTAAIAIANVMREGRGLSDRPLRPLRDEGSFGRELSEKMKKGEPFIRVQDPIQNWDPEREKWENFKMRIILQAVEDYRKARRVRRRADRAEAERTIREVEVFFLSDWFMQMTNVDGEKILKRLQKEAV